MVNGEDYCLDPLLTPNRPSAYSGPLTFIRNNPIATVVNASGLIQTVGSNVPRIDYDPVTRVCKGLLIEEARTNLCLQSGDMTLSPWSFVGGNRVRDVVAPDGTISATRYYGPSTSVPSQTGIIATSTTMTYSIYTKWISGNTSRTFLLRNTTTTTNFVTASFNYLTGVINGGTPSGWVATAVDNGWYRLTYTQSTGITVGDSLQIYVGSTGAVSTYNGEWAVWGAQVEAGAFATSYIPTAASTVTRSAEVCSITGANFNNWFNQSEGTVVIGYDLIAVVDNQRMFSINDNSSANDLSAYTRSGGTRMLAVSQGTTQANPTGLATVLSNTIYKVALGFKTDDFAISVNGATVVTDTSGSMPSNIIKLNLGSNYIGGGPLSGHIRFIQYYPTRLSNATLQSLTS